MTRPAATARAIAADVRAGRRSAQAIATETLGPASTASASTRPVAKPSVAARIGCRLTAVTPIRPPTAIVLSSWIAPSGIVVIAHSSDVSVAAIAAAHSVTIRLRL